MGIADSIGGRYTEREIEMDREAAARARAIRAQKDRENAEIINNVTRVILDANSLAEPLKSDVNTHEFINTLVKYLSDKKKERLSDEGYLDLQKKAQFASACIGAIKRQNFQELTGCLEEKNIIPFKTGWFFNRFYNVLKSGQSIFARPAIMAQALKFFLPKELVNIIQEYDSAPRIALQSQIAATIVPVAAVAQPAEPPIPIPVAPQQKDEKALQQIATAHHLLVEINTLLSDYARLASRNLFPEAGREPLMNLIVSLRGHVEGFRQEAITGEGVEVKPPLTAVPIVIAPKSAITQPALPLYAPASIAPRAAHFQPAEPAASQNRDEKALVFIKNSRDRLFELGNLISEEDRGRFLERLAFYEKLAQHAPLVTKDEQTLYETHDEIELAGTKQQSRLMSLAH